MRYLKRRPTWYRYVVVYFLIVAILIAGIVKWWLRGRDPFSGLHGVPFALVLGAALFTLAAMSEMCATVCWNDTFVRMYARWGFKYLGGKTFELAIAEITEISAGMMSNETLTGRPFTTVNITDGFTDIPIPTAAFFRDGLQQLVSDIARLRPGLELDDNLRAYIRGEFDAIWLK
jgi:hypothetical protein